MGRGCSIGAFSIKQTGGRFPSRNTGVESLETIMVMLLHHPFCPHSRFVRIALAEYGAEVRLVEERAWERREGFLALNPAGTTPVLVDDGCPAVPGAQIIAEYLDETFGPPMMERVYKCSMTAEHGGGAPDSHAIRVARNNIRYHLAYIEWLLHRRDWLAGDRLTYADVAAAAHLSIADYLGDVPWNEDEAAKNWYARIKSRPSFRPILGDTHPGVPPSPSYANLDF